MEFVILLVVFFVLSTLQSAARRKKQGPQAKSPPKTLPDGRPAPQSIRELFGEIRRSMEEAERQAKGGPEPLVLEPPTPVEDVDADPYEVDADAYDDEYEDDGGAEVVDPGLAVEAREVSVVTPERVVIDHEDAEAAIQRRRDWAEDHAKGRQPGDHAAFDARIRAADAEAKPPPAAAPTHRRRALKQAVIWREVLGPPVSLRAPTDHHPQ